MTYMYIAEELTRLIDLNLHTGEPFSMQKVLSKRNKIHRILTANCPQSDVMFPLSSMIVINGILCRTPTS